MTGFVGFVGTIAILSALNLVHFWYGFARYITFGSGENFSIQGMFRGDANGFRFEQIRDVCSFHSNGDYRRRNQFWTVVATLPFTVWYHVTTCIIFFGTWIAKMIANNRNVNYTLSFWGIILTNIVFTGLWLLGGPVSTGLALVHLFLQQRLYSSLLCRRSFPEFLQAAFIGNIFFVETGVASAEEDALRYHVDEMRSGSQENVFLVDDPGWARNNVSTEKSAYDPPLVVVEDPASKRRSSSQEIDITMSSSIEDDLETSSVYHKSEDEWNAENFVDVLEDSSNATDLVTEQSNDLESKLELLNTVAVAADASVVSVKKNHDVYFGVETHEGTQIWKEATKKAGRIFGRDSYTEQHHRWIMEQLYGRKFYTLQDSSRWEIAEETTIQSQCIKVFTELIRAEQEAIVITINERDSLLEKDENRDTEEEEDSSSNKNNGRSTPKFRFKSWRLTPTNQNNDEKQTNNEKQRGKWKSWIRPNSKRRNAQKEKKEHPPEECENERIIFDQDDSIGFIKFQSVLKQAAEKYYPTDYNDEIHLQILEWLEGHRFYNASTTADAYLPASDDETRAKAFAMYDFHRRRLQLVDLLLKEIDIEMAELQDDLGNSQEENQRGDQMEGENKRKSEDKGEVERIESSCTSSKENDSIGGTSFSQSRSQEEIEEIIRARVKTRLSEEDFIEEEKNLESDELGYNEKTNVESQEARNAETIKKTVIKSKRPFSRFISGLRKNSPETTPQDESQAEKLGSNANSAHTGSSRSSSHSSRFVLSFWKKVLERKKQQKAEQSKQNKQQPGENTIEEARKPSAEGLLHQPSEEMYPAETQTDNTIEAVRSGGSVIPASMGDRIELLPKRMFKLQSEQGANIYDHILSVLNDEVLNDDVYMAQSGGSLESGSTGRSSGSFNCNHSDSNASWLAISRTQTPTISPGCKDVPIDPRSLYEYVVFKMRQEETARSCKCLQDPTNDRSEMSNIPRKHQTESSHETKRVIQGLKEIDTCVGQDTASIEASGEKEATVQLQLGSKTEESIREDKSIVNGVTTGGSKGRLDLSFDAEAQQVHTLSILRKGSPSNETAGNNNDKFKSGEGDESSDHPVEIIMHEISTSSLPDTPKAMYTVVREPKKNEDEKTSEQGCQPKKRMMVPKTLSSTRPKRTTTVDKASPSGLKAMEEGWNDIPFDKTSSLSRVDQKMASIESSPSGTKQTRASVSADSELKPITRDSFEPALEGEKAQKSPSHHIKSIPKTSQRSDLDHKDQEVSTQSKTVKSRSMASERDDALNIEERTIPALENIEEEEVKSDRHPKLNSSLFTSSAGEESDATHCLSDIDSDDHVVFEDPSMSPQRKIMSPKSLAMKDIVENNHDNVPVGSLASASDRAQEEHPMASPATETEARPKNAPGGKSVYPNAKKMIMPKTLILSFSEDDNEKQFDDSEKLKQLISASRSKANRRSGFFSSIWKRALRKKKSQRNGWEDKRQQENDDFIDAVAKAEIPARQISNSSDGIRDAGDDPPGNTVTIGHDLDVESSSNCSVGIATANTFVGDGPPGATTIIGSNDEAFISEARDDKNNSARESRDEGNSGRSGIISLVPVISIQERDQDITVDCKDVEMEENDEEMLSQVLSVIESDFIQESNSMGSDENCGKELAKGRIPTEDSRESVQEAAGNQKIDPGTLYRYIMQKLQQENTSCGWYQTAFEHNEEEVGAAPIPATAVRCE